MPKPEPVLPTEASQPVVVPAVPEDPFRAEAAQMAKEVLAELESKEGKRCFVLIIDDSQRKTNDLIKDLNQHATEAGVNYVMRNTITGAKGIMVYEEFAKLGSSEKVVIFMDGYLDTTGRETGPKVTAELMKSVKAKRFATPFIVGESSDVPVNDAIGQAYPEAY